MLTRIFHLNLPNAPTDNPIGAIFDAVPLAAHPFLEGRLVVEEMSIWTLRLSAYAFMVLPWLLQ
jgi:hypothetical protein